MLYTRDNAFLIKKSHTCEKWLKKGPSKYSPWTSMYFTHVFRPQDRFRKSIWVYCLCRTVKKWVRLSCLKSKITRVMLFYPEKKFETESHTYGCILNRSSTSMKRGWGRSPPTPSPPEKNVIFAHKMVYHLMHLHA